MKNNIILGFLVFVIGGIGGGLLTSKSWNGVVYFYSSNQDRVPSSIDKKNDFSNLHGAALIKASKEQLVSQVSILSTDSSVGIELGHFVRRGLNGKKEFACTSLKTIQLQFEAVGISVNGKIPEFQLEGPCKPSKDLNRISALWIPKDKLKSEKPGDLELSYRQGNPITIKTHGVSGEWPTQWRLTGIKLYDNQHIKNIVVISNEELVELRKNNPILIEL
ncbi:MAG: hypothetical protein KDD50_02080 [Bdellovibrionales bacterium]|nr:hypothetical protein [Bdellovibrionales bacterium]